MKLLDEMVMDPGLVKKPAMHLNNRQHVRKDRRGQEAVQVASGCHADRQLMYRRLGARKMKLAVS